MNISRQVVNERDYSFAYFQQKFLSSEIKLIRKLKKKK